MKRTILISIAICISNLICAQNEHLYTYENDDFYANYYPIDYIPTKEVNSVKYTVENSRGKKSYYLKEYEKDNKLTAYYRFEKENKIQLLGNTYDMNAMRISTSSFLNGKLKATTTYKRDKKLNPLEQIKTSAKGKEVYKNTWNYSEDGCLTSSVRYKKGKLSSRFEHEYYSPCDKSKTTKYDKKGNVDQIWTYDCKTEGEVLQKKKDVTQICKWEESDANFIIKVYQTYNEKGRIRKNVRRYTKEDTLIVEFKQFDENNLMTYHASYDKSYAKPLFSRSYYLGKIKSESIYTYDGDLKTSYRYKRKGKEKSSSTYNYGKDGLLVEYKSFNKKGDLKKIITLEYN